MFYKQIIFILPIFWAGIYNGFSSLALYDTFLYQVYNIIFTCAPIIWFAVMDIEHGQDKLLKDPNYYQIGISNLYFSNYIFL